MPVWHYQPFTFYLAFEAALPGHRIILAPHFCSCPPLLFPPCVLEPVMGTVFARSSGQTFTPLWLEDQRQPFRCKKVGVCTEKIMEYQDYLGAIPPLLGSQAYSHVPDAFASSSPPISSGWMVLAPGFSCALPWVRPSRFPCWLLARGT